MALRVYRFSALSLFLFLVFIYVEARAERLCHHHPAGDNWPAEAQGLATGTLQESRLVYASVDRLLLLLTFFLFPFFTFY